MTVTSERVASGATAAQLYERYGNQIYRYCLGRLRDREEAADALQNTFLRVHVALEKGVVPRYEASWLYKIAHNVCLSWFESSGRRALIETPRDLDSLDEALLAGPASEHEAVEDLAEALAALPHNLRQAILLREWQGLSYAEIAEAMDTTVSAVETLIVRARRQMAAMLERSGTHVRRAAAALLDVAGLRGLLSGGLAKVSAGAALVAVGGSGIGATVVLADRPSSLPDRTATSIARPTVPALAGGATATAPGRLRRERAAVVSGATHPVSMPGMARPDVSGPSPAAQQPAAPAAGLARTPPTVTMMSPAPAPEVTTAPLPQPPSVSMPTPLSVPTPSQVDQTATATQLPVTNPVLSVPVPTVTIP